MAEKNIGALVVVEHGQVVGLVSERDYARKLVLMAGDVPESVERVS
jgi:CBS domain-containing protein